MTSMAGTTAQVAVESWGVVPTVLLVLVSLVLAAVIGWFARSITEQTSTAATSSAAAAPTPVPTPAPAKATPAPSAQTASAASVAAAPQTKVVEEGRFPNGKAPQEGMAPPSNPSLQVSTEALASGSPSREAAAEKPEQPGVVKNKRADEELAPAGDAPSSETAQVDDDGHFEAVIERRSCEEVWGFAWNVSAHTRQRLIVAGVDPASPAGHWSARQTATGGRPISRGDEVLFINGAIDYAAFRQELSSSLRIVLRLLVAEAVTSPVASSRGTPSPHGALRAAREALSPGGLSNDSVGSPVGGVRSALARRRAAGLGPPGAERRVPMPVSAIPEQRPESPSLEEKDNEAASNSNSNKINNNSNTNNNHNNNNPGSMPRSNSNSNSNTFAGVIGVSAASAAASSSNGDGRHSPTVARYAAGSLPSPSGSLNSDNKNLPGCLVKNTFIEVQVDEDQDSDDDLGGVRQHRLMQSDPTPVIGIARSFGWAQSPYTPGCIGGVNLAQSITSNASGHSGSNLDSSGTFTSAKSSSCGNNMHPGLPDGRSPASNRTEPSNPKAVGSPPAAFHQLWSGAPPGMVHPGIASSSSPAAAPGGCSSSSRSHAPVEGPTPIGMASSNLPGPPPLPAPLLPAPAAVLTNAPPPPPPPASEPALSSSAGSSVRQALSSSTGLSTSPWKPTLRQPVPTSSSPSPSAPGFGACGGGAGSGGGGGAGCGSGGLGGSGGFGDEDFLGASGGSGSGSHRSGMLGFLAPPPPPPQTVATGFQDIPIKSPSPPPSAPPNLSALRAASGPSSPEAAIAGDGGQSGGESEGEDSGGENGENATPGKPRKPTRRGGRRARHRKLAALARLQESGAVVAGGSPGAAPSMGGEADSPMVGSTGGESSPQRDNEPVRRGGRPPKKAVLAAAAAAAGGGALEASSSQNLWPMSGGGGGGGTTTGASASGSGASVAPKGNSKGFGPSVGAGGVLLLDGEGAGSGSVPGDAMHGHDLSGKRVVIQGLKMSPEFNNQWGRVESFDPTLQRYLVSIFYPPGCETPVSAKLRRENLVVPQTVKLQFEEEEGHHSLIPPEYDPHGMQMPGTMVSSGCMGDAGHGWLSEPAFVSFPPPPMDVSYEHLGVVGVGPGPATDFEDSCSGALLANQSLSHKPNEHYGDPSLYNHHVGGEALLSSTASAPPNLEGAVASPDKSAGMGSGSSFEGEMGGSRLRHRNIYGLQMDMTAMNAANSGSFHGPSADFEDSVAADFAAAIASVGCGTATSPKSLAATVRRRTAGCGTPANAKSESLRAEFGMQE